MQTPFFRAGLLPEEILFLVGKDADGDATSLLSRVDRRIAKVAFVGLHLTPRNRFVILTMIRAALIEVLP